MPWHVTGGNTDKIASGETSRAPSRNSSFSGSLPMTSNAISSRAPLLSNLAGSRTSSFTGISALSVPQYYRVINIYIECT